jgi:hypothetical protein
MKDELMIELFDGLRTAEKEFSELTNIDGVSVSNQREADLTQTIYRTMEEIIKRESDLYNVDLTPAIGDTNWMASVVNRISEIHKL